MAFKTYVPGLILVLKAVTRYGRRYETKLSNYLTTQQMECLTTTLEAAASCLALITPPAVEP